MFSGVLTWFSNFFTSLFGSLQPLFIGVIQACIDVIPVFVTAVLQLFSYACPPPPLPLFSDGAATMTKSIFIQTLNWLFPMQFLNYYFHFIVCALTAYFTLMILGRWTKILT